MSRDTWREVCPNGHTSIRSRRLGFSCQQCNARFPEPLDIKHDDVSRPKANDTGISLPWGMDSIVSLPTLDSERAVFVDDDDVTPHVHLWADCDDLAAESPRETTVAGLTWHAGLCRQCASAEETRLGPEAPERITVYFVAGCGRVHFREDCTGLTSTDSVRSKTFEGEVPAYFETCESCEMVEPESASETKTARADP